MKAELDLPKGITLEHVLNWIEWKTESALAGKNVAENIAKLSRKDAKTWKPVAQNKSIDIMMLVSVKWLIERAYFPDAPLDGDSPSKRSDFCNQRPGANQ